MKFKGTKGEWALSIPFDGAILIGGNVRANVLAYSLEGLELEDKANALLISKAPEMLEFIKSIVDDYENGLIEDIECLAVRAELLYQKATEL